MYCNSTLIVDTTTDLIIEHHRHYQTIAFRDHLMSQMKKHHDNNLNMFNKTTKYIKAHVVHNYVSHKQLVRLLTRYYQFHFF